MKIIQEVSLKDFEFWSGAEYTRNALTDGELDQIEAILEDCSEEPMTETQLNDFFWFENDTIAEWLGYTDWEDLEARRDEESA